MVKSSGLTLGRTTIILSPIMSVLPIFTNGQNDIMIKKRSYWMGLIHFFLIQSKCGVASVHAPGSSIFATAQSRNPRGDLSMTRDNTRRAIEEYSRLYTCTKVGEYYRIRTPFLYPDGDVIDLFLRLDGNFAIVTDLAETTGWLRLQSPSPHRSKKQNEIIEDILLNHGVKMDRGMLQIECRLLEDVPTAVTRVPQAAICVSDLWYSIGTHSTDSFTEKVANYMVKCSVPFQ